MLSKLSDPRQSPGYIPVSPSNGAPERALKGAWLVVGLNLFGRAARSRCNAVDYSSSVEALTEDSLSRRHMLREIRYQPARGVTVLERDSD
jgi:hypothetical protein